MISSRARFPIPSLRTFAHGGVLLALALSPLLAADPLKPGEPVVLKLTSDREGSLRESPVILLPTIYLDLGVAGKVSALKQGGSGTAKAKAAWATGGIDKAFVQGLAQKIQDDLAAKLRASGYTVKLYADLQDREGIKNAARRAPDPAWGVPLATSDVIGCLALTAAPSDAQAFKIGFRGAIFDQFMSRGRSTLGEGTIFIPTYTFMAPQAWATTERGYKRVSATANVAHGMNLSNASLRVLTEKGGWGGVGTKEQVINIGEKVGELTAKDTTDNLGNTLSAALGTLLGTASIKGSSGYYHLEVDRAAYEAAVLRGAFAFNDAIAATVKKK